MNRKYFLDIHADFFGVFSDKIYAFKWSITVFGRLDYGTRGGYFWVINFFKVSPQWPKFWFFLHFLPTVKIKVKIALINFQFLFKLEVPNTNLFTQTKISQNPQSQANKTKTDIKPDIIHEPINSQWMKSKTYAIHSVSVCVITLNEILDTLKMFSIKSSDSRDLKYIFVIKKYHTKNLPCVLNLNFKKEEKEWGFFSLLLIFYDTRAYTNT